MSRQEFKCVKQHHRCSVVSHGYRGEVGGPGSYRLDSSSLHIEAGSPEVATQLSSYSLVFLRCRIWEHSLGSLDLTGAQKHYSCYSSRVMKMF